MMDRPIARPFGLVLAWILLDLQQPLLLSSSPCYVVVTAFVPSLQRQRQQQRPSSGLASAPIKESETEAKGVLPTDAVSPSPSSSTSSSSQRDNNGVQQQQQQPGDTTDGLPWWWEYVWNNFDFLKPTDSENGTIDLSATPVTLGDSATVLRYNIEQLYGGYKSVDGCPVATGALDDLAEGTMFVGLQNYYQSYGSPYKLCFGPKSFLVISDPIQAKHILRDANTKYDKGVLAEILEPIMGKGLIPADPETWKVRRRAIVPAFHKAWLEHMVGLFAHCNTPLINELNRLSDLAATTTTTMSSSTTTTTTAARNQKNKAEMETFFCSVALDIIGLSVFNYPFGSVTSESPVIKAVYSALVEAEHRSMTPAPYWNLPLANLLVPRLRKFNADLRLLNSILDDLIVRAKNTRQVEDIAELESRNYENVKDPSLLRFLVDMRGADLDNKQLRDDLMTMMIAGHETTAAVLTWALFELVKNPDIMATAQAEIDQVLGDRTPTFDDIKKLQFVRLIVAETLRMYPEPPLLIRRCRTPDDLPNQSAHVMRGMDMFIAIYNIHRDERFWPNANTFDPSRFTRPYQNPVVPEWAGYDPTKWEGKLYPNEISADFAFLPFGGGARKCIGDDFATLEATVTLAMILRRFDFAFDPDFMQGKSDVNDRPWDLQHPVGMKTGATIHTRNGLNMLVWKRTPPM